MPSAMSNLALLNKCKNFVLADPTNNALDELIKDALITANREISDVDNQQPLAWNRETYDELFTRTYAEISGISAADPAVITADSLDPDLTSDHGFQNDDIVLIDGIYGTDYEDYYMNRRLFRATRASATTLNVSWLNDQDLITSAAYGAYDSGGYVYHAGLLIPKSTIEPSAGVDAVKWTIKRIYNVMFDLKPAHPIGEDSALADQKWLTPGGRPSRWRYARYGYGAMGFSDMEHMLYFYPPCSQRHNIRIFIEKEYPDLATWDNSTYPPHPPEVHDYIWHRALANLATNAERARRETASSEKEAGRLMGSIEVLYAKMWAQKAAQDELAIQKLSRNMLGYQPSHRGFSA